MRRRYITSPVPQDTKEIIQYKHIDHEQVDEKQQAALRAKFKENLAEPNAESKKRSTTRETSAAEEQQNRAESILEHQTEVEVEFHVEGEKAWLRCNRSGETVSQFNMQRAQELTRPQREDGMQDARNGHAQVASRAKAEPEEYGQDAERQDVRQDEQEFRTAQQQIKKMTQARNRSEGSAIIN